MANAMMTGAVRLTVPEVLRVELTGTKPRGVTAKDIVLHLLALPALRAGAGVGKVFEFAGPGIAQLNTDERTTLTNMTAELGGFTGIVAPDAETVRFLKARRGIDVVLEPWMCSDPGASYFAVLSIDLSCLSPMVAAPGDPGRGLDLSALESPVVIDIAYGGSCTAGKPGGFRPVSRGPGVGGVPGVESAGPGEAVPAVRYGGGPRLLRGAGLFGHLRRRGCGHPATRLRCLRQLWPGHFDRRRDGDGERDQPQLPRTIRARSSLARQPPDGGSECGGGGAHLVRGAPGPARRVVDCFS